MTANQALVAALRERFDDEGEAEYAAGAQQYMKSTMPYFGVRMPRLRVICREEIARHPIGTYEDWRDTVLALFRNATHRELWYAAEALAEAPRFREYAARLESLDIYEAIITEGAWWDIVDGVAAHLVGGIFQTDAAWLSARMREWSTDEHLWKRRTSIICQLRRGKDVDLALLHDCIAPNLDDRDFFIRKAIGWALRQVAKSQPQEVVRYVEEHRDALSGLSKREALKNLLKSGLVERVP